MTRTHSIGALVSCALLASAACSDNTNPSENNEWVIIDEDTGSGGVDEDAGVVEEDAGVVDEDMGSGSNVVSDMPQANVFPQDPTTNVRMTSIVTLPRPTADEGNLTNAFAEVNNCIEEQGEELNFMGFTAGYLCKEVQTALPAEDGNYLHITPPVSDGQAGDPFAEVQMYHHVNAIHDYYKDTLGLDSMDFPLPAIVNLKLFVTDLAAGFLGVPAGWIPFDNAAFLFPEAFAQFGLPPRDEGAIVFGQGTAIDFSYDASVIYHEYTHAMIGSQRLNRPFVDSWGANNTPGAVNEGVADYFAATKSDAPDIGAYGLAAFGQNYIRNLATKRTCPADIETEIHADGRIVGSMLWAMRDSVGADIVDNLVLAAIESSTLSTGFDEFTALLLDEAQLANAPVYDELVSIAEDFGMRGCERIRPWDDFQINQNAGEVPFVVPGTAEVGDAAFQQFAPGYVQFSVEIPADKVAVVTWTMSAGQGGFGGGGGQPPALDAVLRKDSHIEFGSGDYTADVELDPVSAGNNAQSVTLAASCAGADGLARIAFLNRGQSGVSVTRGQLAIEDADGATDVIDCVDAD